MWPPSYINDWQFEAQFTVLLVQESIIQSSSSFCDWTTFHQMPFLTPRCWTSFSSPAAWRSFQYSFQPRRRVSRLVQAALWRFWSESASRPANSIISSFFTGDKLPCGQRVHSLGLCAFESSYCGVWWYDMIYRLIYSKTVIYQLLAVGLFHCWPLLHCCCAWSLNLSARYLDDKGVAKNLEAWSDCMGAGGCIWTLFMVFHWPSGEHQSVQFGSRLDLSDHYQSSHRNSNIVDFYQTTHWGLWLSRTSHKRRLLHWACLWWHPGRVYGSRAWKAWNCTRFTNALQFKISQLTRMNGGGWTSHWRPLLNRIHHGIMQELFTRHTIPWYSMFDLMLISISRRCCFFVNNSECVTHRTALQTLSGSKPPSCNVQTGMQLTHWWICRMLQNAWIVWVSWYLPSLLEPYGLAGSKGTFKAWPTQSGWTTP